MNTGRLIIQLGIAAYILFTLLPNSGSQMVAFPWVMLWQMGLLCFAIAGLLNLWRKGNPFYLLGNGFDWAIGSGFVTLCLSTMFAKFPNQAMWYSLTAFGYLMALYVTNNFLHKSNVEHSSTSGILPILKFQGLLGIAVIVESLFIWTTESWLPRLANLAKLNQWGLNLSYDFSDLESRNWAPMGHQNYVAGFLMLVLLLFVSLAIASTGKMAIAMASRNWLRITGFVYHQFTRRIFGAGRNSSLRNYRGFIARWSLSRICAFRKRGSDRHI